jgi:hypothetical protein
LRSLFLEWGLPTRIRVDNGAPWGSWGDLPTDLALWLIGLGIDVWWNPPRCPQDNAVVERSQDLAQAWAEPQQCRSVRQFQLRLHREDRVQREEYPAIHGVSRMAAYPELKHSGRRYSLAWEKRHWDWDRVCAVMSGYAVGRHVDCSGKIGVYHRKLYIGTIHKGRDVHLQFDPERLEWVVTDDAGSQLHRSPADWFTPNAIRRLRMTPTERVTQNGKT